MRTPGHDFELAAGWLVHEGLVTAPPADDRLLHRRGPDAGAGVQRRHRHPRRPAHRATPGTGHAGSGSSACGVCGKDSIAEALGRPGGGPLVGCAARPRRRTPAAGAAALASAAGLRRAPAACTRPALATADGELLVVREDVGRHNAVDKVTGARVVAGLSPAEACLVVSGRAGFELVQKAVAAGVGALVAVGAPTSLSVDLAKQSGLALYGFTSAGRTVRYA